MEGKGCRERRQAFHCPVMPFAGTGRRPRPELCLLAAGSVVRGQVWLDVNADGVRTPDEVGYPGNTTVRLLLGETVVATTTTNGAGQYVFLNVTPGNYSVLIERPAGFAFSPSNQGADDTVDSDVDPVTGRSGVVAVPADQDVAGPDAGLVGGVPPGSLSLLAPSASSLLQLPGRGMVGSALVRRVVAVTFGSYTLCIEAHLLELLSLRPHSAIGSGIRWNACIIRMCRGPRWRARGAGRDGKPFIVQ